MCFLKQEAEKNMSWDDKEIVQNSGTDFMCISYA